MRIGVPAVQSDFREHIAMLRRLGKVTGVRAPGLDGLDGLVIPGGESTTFMRLLRPYGLDEAIREVEVLAEHDGEPVLLRKNRFLVASCHPELTGDTRIHEFFLQRVGEATSVRA